MFTDFRKFPCTNICLNWQTNFLFNVLLIVTWASGFTSEWLLPLAKEKGREKMIKAWDTSLRLCVLQSTFIKQLWHHPNFMQHTMQTAYAPTQSICGTLTITKCSPGRTIFAQNSNTILNFKKMKIVVPHQTTCTFNKIYIFTSLQQENFWVFFFFKFTENPLEDLYDLYAIHVINMYYKWIGFEGSDLDMVIVYLKT